MTKEKGEDLSSDDGIALKRRLNLFHGVSIICGLIIGSGIYVAPTAVMHRVPSAGVAMIVWLAGGVFETLGALCFAELGTTIPVAGEKYAYLNEMFGPFMGFLYLWQYSFITRPAANSVKCIMFASYLLQPFFPCGVPHGPIVCLAVALGCIVTYLNCRSVEGAANAQTLITVLSIGSLSIIVLVGIVFIGKGNTEFLNSFFDTEDREVDIGEIFLGMYSALFAFAGWIALNFMVEELKNPYRNLPIAIIISMALVTCLYLLANLSYIAVLGADGIRRSDAVAVSFAEQTMGIASWLIVFLIAMNNCASLNSGMMVGSRLVFAGARSSQLPDFMALISIKSKSPSGSLIFQCFLMIICILLIDVYTLLANVTFMTILGNGLVVYGMIWLRRKEPDRHRPLKLPLIIPIIYAALQTILVVVPVIVKPLSTAMGLIIVLCTAVPYYVIFVVMDVKILDKYADKFTIFVQKLLMAVKQDTPLDITAE